jgi:sulfocyanin
MACMLLVPIHGPAPVARAASFSPADWLVWNLTTHTATLTLIAGYNGARHGLNFNGYSTGSMVVQVPKGARVQVVFQNRGTFPHSIIIARSKAHMRTGTQGFPLAFPGAYTPQPMSGIAPGKSQTFTFVAGQVGHYEIVCGVDHHAQSGMWDTFEVTASGLPTLILPV